MSCLDFRGANNDAGQQQRKACAFPVLLFLKFPANTISGYATRKVPNFGDHPADAPFRHNRRGFRSNGANWMSSRIHPVQATAAQDWGHGTPLARKSHQGGGSVPNPGFWRSMARPDLETVRTGAGGRLFRVSRRGRPREQNRIRCEPSAAVLGSGHTFGEAGHPGV